MYEWFLCDFLWVSHTVKTTNRYKIIDKRDVKPCKEANAVSRRCKAEGRGFKPR